MAEILDFKISVKRIVKRQKNRPNHSSTRPEDYYKIAICIPFVDSFIHQLNERFLSHQLIFKGFFIVFVI